MRCLLVLPLLLLMPALALAESQTSPTDGGTLEVRVSYEDIMPREQSALLIEFINPQTSKVQEHIDYSIHVSSGSTTIFGPTPIIHSSEGVIRGLKVQFPDVGTYTLDLSIVGILFQPIDAEMVSLDIPVGIAHAQSPEQGGGGCLIATAAFGSELAPHVQHLREVRDEKLLTTDAGIYFMSAFNQVYYLFSPGVADMERESPILKGLVGTTIQPMLLSLHLMEHADSEPTVIAYGVVVIILNVLVYIIGPALGLLWLVRLTRRYVRPRACLG